MLRVLITNILHPKIVDGKGEADGTGVLLPETWRHLALAVAMLGKLWAMIPACGRPYIPFCISQ